MHVFPIWSPLKLLCKQCAPYCKMYLWRRNICHTLSCPSILTLAATTHTTKSHTWRDGCRKQKEGRTEGQKEAWRDGWKDRHDGATEAQRCQGPVVLLALQLFWLMRGCLQAPSLSTQKNTRKKKTIMRANEKACSVNFTMMQSHNRYHWKKARDQAEDIWERFTDTLPEMQKVEYLYHLWEKSQTTMH